MKPGSEIVAPALLASAPRTLISPFYDQLITDLLAELGASGYSKQMFLPFAGYAIEKSLIIQYF